MILATASTNDVVIAALATVSAVVATVFGVTRTSTKNTADVKETVGDTGTRTLAEMMNEHTQKLTALDERVAGLSNDFAAYQAKATAARAGFEVELGELEQRLPPPPPKEDT
jgi:uncharacterized protein YlxW (UPF0749 family)